jgi:hypothetical protein
MANGAWPFELPRQLPPRPTVPAITAGDLATRLFIIADDSMMGRESGERGNEMVTDYIAAEFRRLGLQPAGENGTYFQTIPYLDGGFEGTPSLSFRGQGLVAWQDFAPMATIGRAAFADRFEGNNVPTLFAGRWGDSTVAIDPAKARGAILVLTVPVSGNGAPMSAF